VSIPAAQVANPACRALGVDPPPTSACLRKNGGSDNTKDAIAPDGYPYATESHNGIGSGCGARRSDYDRPMTIPKVLVGHMIDEVGVRRTVEALDACLNNTAVMGDDLDKLIADCVSKASLALSEPSRKNGATAASLRRLLDGGRVQQSEDHVLLLKAFVLSLADRLGTEPIAHAIVKVNNKPVLTLTWDSGGVGGNGVVEIHKIGGRFWGYDDHSSTVWPPFSSLQKAVEGTELKVNGATASVSARGLTSAELVSLLLVQGDIEPGHRVSVNGEAWVVGETQPPKLQKVVRARKATGKNFNARSRGDRDRSQAPQLLPVFARTRDRPATRP